MEDEPINSPPILQQIQRETEAAGFHMASDTLTGSLLRTLAAIKPAGRFLELGTGTGLATTWLLDGMDQDSQLLTVEHDPKVARIAQKYLGQDQRVSFHINDAALFLERSASHQYDLIFADTWAGKYTHLNEALKLIRDGGLYVVDDMLPQPNWPDGHALKVAQLVNELENRSDLRVAKMNWSTGLIVAARVRQ